VPSQLYLGCLLALITTLPLSWKWQLGMIRTSIAVVLLSALAAAVVYALTQTITLSDPIQVTLVWAITMTMAAGVLAYRFYRDPERRSPSQDDVVVSPADGRVIYVHESRSGTLPVATKDGRPYSLEELTKTRLRSDDAVVIGISMSFLDVHVNRAPIRGRIARLHRFRGRFESLRRLENIFVNERTTTVIELEDVQIAVVQIASRLVRQIASFVREGDYVLQGQRIGIIRFGSQVDLVVPRREGLTVLVQPGERVSAGESIVALLSTAERTEFELRRPERMAKP
jgi:phosphatidylserine decarboxylase